MKILLPLFVGISAFATTPAANPGTGFERLVKHLSQSGLVTRKGELLIHSPAIVPLIKLDYRVEDLDAATEQLHDSLALKVDERGLAKASDRLDSDKGDPTHYDAVWVRDSLWIYLGLRAKPANQAVAQQMLMTLLDYFASDAQLDRFAKVIKDPTLVDAPDGSMNVVHIRFDARSPGLADVVEGGKPQKWNHKQNDALGLFLDLFSRAVLEGSVQADAITPARAKAITLLPAYLGAIRFYAMADAGSWEEIERVNTSSVALVTSGLERLLDVLSDRTAGVQAVVAKLGVELNHEKITMLIDKGYDRIQQQLAAGGESPLYARTDVHYRTADAALLNVIYPAKLSRLGQKDFDRVLSILRPLVGTVGIKRYLNDSYQSGNFWFAADSKTDDTSSSQSFANRGKQFLADSEAQWFFDSWYSQAVGTLYARYHSPRYRQLELKFLNRALAQITGGTTDTPVLGADGRPVKRLALPESYNTIRDPRTGNRFFSPSPITPLNWAKASLALALQQMARSCKP